MNQYRIIDGDAIQKRIDELEKFYIKSRKVGLTMDLFDKEIVTLKQILSQSTPLIPDIKDIQIWLSKQSYQKEYGEQEYMMYYDVDIPKIIKDYILNLKLDI